MVLACTLCEESVGSVFFLVFFFFQAEDGIRDYKVTGVQTCALPISLLRLLAGDGSGLAAIGDPDQAIYGFRGADVGFFLSFGRDFPRARTVALSRNYRSSPVIVAGAMQAMADRKSVV